MRITRETLLNIARDTAAQRTRSDRNILGVYLYGSLLEEEFLLGGTADIDLVFIHMDTAETSREIVPLTDEVHLDIAHHYERDYRQARQLRVNPWLGPAINECQALYDPQHFLDFTQAGVRGQFERLDNVYQRALGLADRAGESGRWLVSGMHHAIATLSQRGINVVADHVLVEQAWVQECAALFSGLPAWLIGVRCPLDVLEEREKQRRDRTLGQARLQHERVHVPGIYDLEVDTSLFSAEECAERIRQCLTGGLPPVALQRIRYSAA